jgi:DNA-binding NarL/FixJ family response regulator
VFLSVAGEATQGVEAVELAGRLRPAAVTMDLDMPVKGGAAATREICRGRSSGGRDRRGSKSSEQVAEAMSAGARWHVAKRDKRNIAGVEPRMARAHALSRAEEQMSGDL